MLPEYLREIHNEFPTSTRKVVQFLNEQANPEDTVYAIPDSFNCPLMFYLGDRFRFCCVLTHYTILPREKMKELQAPLFIEENSPKWFISFGNHMLTQQLLSRFSRPYPGTGSQIQYQYMGYLDVYWDQIQRPEWPQHRFGPLTDYRADADTVHIFKQIDSRLEGK